MLLLTNNPPFSLSSLLMLVFQSSDFPQTLTSQPLHNMVPLLVLSTLFSIKFAQQCLESPPELEFIEDGDENGIPVYRATLTYDAKTFTTDEYHYPTSFTTRVHNDMLPSPTIRMKQDAIYRILLINNLGPNDPNDPGIMNEFHYPNTTNIHTHGILI